MKTVRLTAFLLGIMLLLGGCQSRQMQQLPPRSGQESAPSGSQAQEPQPPAPPEEPDAPQQPTNQWYNETYIAPLSLYRLDDFKTPADIPAEDWVHYYLLANYDGPGKLPIPEGYRNQQSYGLLIPAQEVEGFLTTYFGLEAPYLRTAEGYVESSQSYGFGTLGLSATSFSQVTNAQQQGQELSIIFDVYLSLGDTAHPPEGQDLDHPVATRMATITLLEEGFRVATLQTLYQADLDALLGSPEAIP